MTFLKSIVLVACFTSACWGQTPDGFKKIYTFHADGTKTVEIVPKTEADLRYDARQADEQALAYLEGSDIEFLLLSPSSVDLDLLCDEEISKSQREELARISDEFRIAGAGLRAPEFRKVKLAHWRQVEAVLLPEQMSSITQKLEDMPGLVMTSIVATELGRKLEITPEQKEQLVEHCRSLNREIKETLAELEKKTALHREKMNRICEEVLSEKQFKELNSRFFSNDAFMKSLSIFDLDSDTNFRPER